MKTGIYIILNTNNGHKYVGSAVDITRRWTVHKFHLRHGSHNPYFQNAFNKYREEAFIFRILEECSREELLNKEQFYLDNLKPEYNLSKFATSGIDLVLSPEARKKISEAQIKLCEDPQERQFRSDKAKIQWATPGIMDGVIEKLHAGAIRARVIRKKTNLSNGLKRYYSTLTLEEKRLRSWRQNAIRYGKSIEYYQQQYESKIENRV